MEYDVILNGVHIGCHNIFRHTLGGNVFKAILITVTLAPLSEAAMPVSYKLMGTGSGDTFNLKGKVDMLKHTMMAAGV